MTTTIAGYCDPRFNAVREAFQTNFDERGEVGASVHVMVRGETVVDLAGGFADEARTRPFTADTLVNFYSVGKAFVALLLLQLVDRNEVRLDDPIAAVWPEFAAEGKGAATIRHALCHRAGVPAIRETLTNDDLWKWERMADALAATAPWFEPGTKHTYHTNTYGHLIGEIVHRISGQLPGERLRSIADPTAADVWFGVPASEHHRCAEVIWAPARGITPGVEFLDEKTATPKSSDNTTPPPVASLAEIDPDVGRMIALGYTNPPGFSSMGVVNTPEWRSAQVPSTNGHGTAKGVARLYDALLTPDRLLSTELRSEAASVQSEGWCPVLAEEATFGLGFKPTTLRRPFGPNPGSFGHFGTGGALGFADPVDGVAFGYVMNHVIPRWQSTRNRTLMDAVYKGLGRA